MRITNYPEATSLTKDDYIIMDNANSSPSKIKASHFTAHLEHEEEEETEEV